MSLESIALLFFTLVPGAIAFMLVFRRRQNETNTKSALLVTQPEVRASADGPDTTTDNKIGDHESANLYAVSLNISRKLYGVAFDTDIALPEPLPLPQAEVMASVRAILSNIVARQNYAPRRPLLLPKLVQALNDDEISRRELSRIIASDPALAGNLLQLANSSFYRVNPEPIEGLDRAIAVLGTEGMRSLISATLLQPVFKVRADVFPRFGELTWQHSLLAAGGAEAHAAVIEYSDPFAAQLLSLMMGLATIVVFRVAVDEYGLRQVPPHAGVIMSLIDSQAPLVARQIAASWDLSDRMDTALADQLTPAEATKSSLGRSLEFGRFIGALAILRERQIIDDDEVTSALHSGGTLANTYERIWNKMKSKL